MTNFSKPHNRKELLAVKYDFDSIIDRNGKDALAVDVIPFEGAQVKPGFSMIPMWVEQEKWCHRACEG